MHDSKKSREELIKEVKQLRVRVDELEKSIGEGSYLVGVLDDSPYLQMKVILDSIPDIAWLKDGEGKFVAVNEALCKAIGMKAEDVIGKTDYEVSPKDLARQYVADDEEVMRTRRTKQIEEQWGGKGKERILIETTKSPVFNRSGQVVGTCGVARNITRRKQTEEALRDSEERHRMLFEGASEGIVAAEIETKRFLFANPAICRMLGYTEEELKQMSVFDIHPKEALKQIIDQFESQARTHQTLAIEIPCLRKDGSIVYADISAARVKMDGKVCLVGFFSDVTERKNIEQAIQESEEKYRRLVESLRQEYFFYSHGLDGIFQYVSPSIKNVLGYTQEQFLTHYTEYLTENPINEEVIEHTNLGIQGKQQLPYEVEIYHQDGSVHRLEVSEVPILDDEGKVTAVEGIAHDITDRWQAKMQLQKARDELEERVEQRTKELEEANLELRNEISERQKAQERLLGYQKELRSLASELSLAEERLRRKVASDVHDHIGQNLAISKMKVEELRQSLADSKAVESLDEVRELLGEAIERTRSLTTELSPPVLYELGFERALEWLVNKAREQYGLSVQFIDDGQNKKISEDVRVMLFQAVRELLINVAKHAKATEVIVSVRKSTDMIWVKVEDNGKGFDFLKERPRGVSSGGFGLFSIRERLGHLGGRFDIESTPDKGTLISLAAPLNDTNVREG